MSLDGAITNLASWAGNVIDADYGWRILCSGGLSLQQGRPVRAVALWRLRFVDVFGNAPRVGGICPARRADQRGRFLDGNDEPGELGRKRDLPVFALTQLAAMALHMAAWSRRSIQVRPGSGSSWLQSPR